MKGSGLITGSVDDLLISKANFSTLDGTELKADGRIKGLPNADKLYVDLSITELSSTKSDLMKVLPDSTLPASIELPESIKISGKVKGGMANLTTTTTINTSFGTGTFSGTLKISATAFRHAITEHSHLRNLTLEIIKATCRTTGENIPEG